MDALVLNLKRRRGGKNVRTAVLLGRKVNNKKVVVGWSRCKLSTDKFDSEIGMKIAEGRISSYVEGRKPHDLPPSLTEDVKKFVDRCKRYFKGSSVVVAAAKKSSVRKPSSDLAK